MFIVSVWRKSQLLSILIVCRFIHDCVWFHPQKSPAFSCDEICLDKRYKGNVLTVLKLSGVFDNNSVAFQALALRQWRANDRNASFAIFYVWEFDPQQLIDAEILRSTFPTRHHISFRNLTTQTKLLWKIVLKAKWKGKKKEMSNWFHMSASFNAHFSSGGCMESYTIHGLC